jgi:hypothetical protein
MFTGCAVMHRSAIGERDAPTEDLQPIAVDVSDVGVDAQGIARSGTTIAKAAGRNSGAMKNLAGGVELLAWATSMSPRTGNPTWDDLWADSITLQLRARCPDGVITGIQTTRESASYPYISGEIVRVRAYCETK